MRQAWTIQHSAGPAQPFHARDPGDLVADIAGPTALVHTVPQRAIVLGSRQSPSLLRNVPPTVEIATRRSGGGLVEVDPDLSLWVDLVLPRAHHLWDDDVNRSFHWVGETWQSALADVGVPTASSHTGSLQRRDHGAVICFAGLGPGEVTVQNAEGLPFKVVGLSQRRTRDHARFQCLAVKHWSSEPLATLLVPGALPRDLRLEDLRIGMPPALPALNLDDLAHAFLRRLTAA